MTDGQDKVANGAMSGAGGTIAERGVAPSVGGAIVVFPIVSGAVILISATAVVAAMVALGLGYGLGAWKQSELSTLGAAISLIGGLAGLFPVWFLSRQSLQAGAMGFMAGIVIRLVICGTAVLIARGMMESTRDARFFSIWVAGWYLALLAIEVKLLSSYLSKAGRAAAASGQTPTPDS